MNYKIIFTALAITVLVGSLLALGVTRTVSNQKDLTVRNTKTEDVNLPPQINSVNETAPVVNNPTNNSAETAVIAGNSGAVIMNQSSLPPTNLQASSTPVTKTETKTELQPVTVRNDVFDGKKIVKTEAEWRKLLTAQQFYVLREKGTEKPYTGKYTDNKEAGEYHCAACGLALFTSKNKFDSETGWISFYKPIVAVNVLEEADKSLEETRTEVLCARCNSHLGHVFDDGPEPTGLRYCINSASLDFKKRR